MSPQLWMPGVEAIAATMRPRASSPAVPTPTLPLERRRIEQDEDRDLDACDQEQRHACAGEYTEDEEADSGALGESNEKRGNQEDKRRIPVSAKRGAGQEHEGRREGDQEGRCNGICHRHRATNPSKALTSFDAQERSRRCRSRARPRARPL